MVRRRSAIGFTRFSAILRLRKAPGGKPRPAGGIAQNRASLYRLYSPRPYAQPGSAMDLKPGDKAPTFKLATDGEGEVSLAGLKGKAFVLYFYPKDNTSGCTREALEFSKLAKKFQDL